VTISKSSSTHTSVEAMIFLTQIKTPPPPGADLSLLKFVKSALKASGLLIPSLSHDPVLTTTLGFYVSTKSQNYNALLQKLVQLTCSKTSDLPSILYTDDSATYLTFDPASTFLLIKKNS
jgi:hypothetical protein